MRTTVTQLLMVCLLALVGFTSCYNEDNKIQATCFDEIQNQEEVMVDCGGPFCPECLPTCDNGIMDVDPDNAWIELGIDCGGPCPSCCGNGVQDAFETWVDCGGPECEPCDPCFNGIQDGGETGIDCDDDPLTECPNCFELCNDGLHNGTEDCTDCGGSQCLPCNDDHCTNGVLDNELFDGNGNPRPTDHLETGIDCGGCLCPTCLSLCGDGILNGNELGIDCGGPDCGIPCYFLCGDGILNGFETGIDCGGECVDCIELCGDGLLNGNETNVDCGGPVCQPCTGADEYLTWYANGVHYESSIITLTRDGFANPNTLTMTGTSSLSGPPSFTFTLSADPFTGWPTGDYPANTATALENFSTYADPADFEYSTTVSTVGLTFDVTALNFFIGQAFQGTFEGEMKGPGGETVVITNGQFKSTFDN